MRFGGRNFPVIHIAREANPRALAEDAPLVQRFAVGSDFQYHVEPGIRHDQVPVGGWAHVVNVVEARQRNVLYEIELGKPVYQRFGSRTGVQPVPLERTSLKTDRCVAENACVCCSFRQQNRHIRRIGGCVTRIRLA